MFLKEVLQNRSTDLKTMLLKYNKGDIVFKELSNIVSSGEYNDKIIYKKIKEKIGNIYFSNDIVKSAQAMANDTIGFLQDSIIKNTDYYLNIGCGNGYFVSYMGTTLQATKDTIMSYSVDTTDQRIEKYGYHYEKYDGTNFPICNFDLVTMFMGLYGNSLETYRKILNNIYGIINYGGILFIKEHDVRDKEDLSLVIVQHDIQSYIYGDDEYVDPLEIKMISSKDMTTELTEIGFRVIKQSEPHGPTRYVKYLAEKKI